MKRWLVIALLIPLASVEACGSGPDLEKTASDVTVIQVSPSSNCGGTCGEFVSGFALGSALAFPMLQSSNGGPSVSSVDFGSRATQISPWSPTIGGGGTGGATNFDIASAGDGQLFWAGNPLLYTPGTTTEDQIAVFFAAESAVQTPSSIQSFMATLPLINTSSGNCNDGGSSGSGSGNCGNPTNNAVLAGLAADSDAIYVEYAQDLVNANQGSNVTPDSPYFPGSQLPSEDRDPAAIARIDRNAKATSATVGGFFLLPNVAVHMLAQSSTTLYFPDQGQSNNPSNVVQVLALTKRPFGGAPTAIGAVPQSAGASIVGIAANDAAVAWAASYVGQSTPGCRIFASVHDGPMQTLYDGQSSGGNPPLSGCSGMAVDDAYAYVAITNIESPPSNSGGSGSVLVGSGIARVPLAGGALQIVPLQSNKWYGPRRVYDDEAFVYAIDPGFVARFAKTDFH